jgi:hypothetical protein
MTFAVTARHLGDNGTSSSQTVATGSTTPTADSLFVVGWGSEADSSNTAVAIQPPTGGSLSYTQVATLGEGTGGSVIPWDGDSRFRLGMGVYRADVGGSPSAFAVTCDSYSGTTTAFYAAACCDITGHDTDTPVVQSAALGATKGAGDSETGTVVLGSTPTAGNLILVIVTAGADGGGGFASPTAGSGKTFTQVLNDPNAFQQTAIFYRVADGAESTTITFSDLGQGVGHYGAVAVEIAAESGAGAQSITPDAVTVTATPGALTVAPGAVDITPAAVTVNATPGTLSLALNAALTGPTVSVTPGTVTVAPGAVDITPDPTTVTVTPGTVTVANAGGEAQEIIPGAVTVTATAGTLSLDMAVELDAATVNITPGTLTVTTGAVDITPDPVTVTTTPGSLTVTQGAVDITPEPVTVTITPGTLTVDQSVTLTAPTIDVTPGTLAVGQGIVVFPDAVTVTATPGTLTMSTGAVDIIPDPVAVTATPGTLAVGLGVELTAPIVTATPGTLTVAAGATGITPEAVTVQVTPGVLVLTGGDTADPNPIRLTYRQQTRLTHRETSTLTYREVQ